MIQKFQGKIFTFQEYDEIDSQRLKDKMNSKSREVIKEISDKTKLYSYSSSTSNKLQNQISLDSQTSEQNLKEKMNSKESDKDKTSLEMNITNMEELHKEMNINDQMRAEIEYSESEEEQNRDTIELSSKVDTKISTIYNKNRIPSLGNTEDVMMDTTDKSGTMNFFNFSIQPS